MVSEEKNNEISIYKKIHKKKKLIIKEEKEFIEQKFRKDILINLLRNIKLGGEVLFNIIMSDDNSSPSIQRQGDLYETLCEILIVTKCINKLNYTNIMVGQVLSLKPVTDIKILLNDRRGITICVKTSNNNSMFICCYTEYF